ILRRKIGRDPTEGELYIAHFLGAGGASKLINAAAQSPSAKAAQLFPRAAAANRSIFYDKQGNARSVTGVYGLLVTKLARATPPAARAARAAGPGRRTAGRRGPAGRFGGPERAVADTPRRRGAGHSDAAARGLDRAADGAPVGANPGCDAGVAGRLGARAAGRRQRPGVL